MIGSWIYFKIKESLEILRPLYFQMYTYVATQKTFKEPVRGIILYILSNWTRHYFQLLYYCRLLGTYLWTSSIFSADENRKIIEVRIIALFSKISFLWDTLYSFTLLNRKSLSQHNSPFALFSSSLPWTGDN